MLLASLAIERSPLLWVELPDALALWVQNAGGAAMVGLSLWILSRVLQRESLLVLPRSVPEQQRERLTTLFLVGSVIGVAGYALVLLLWIARSVGVGFVGGWFPRTGTDKPLTVGDYCLTISGAFALVVVVAPIVWTLLTRVRMGRIWALARLSFKEAVRGRVIWVFGAFALLPLFAEWFVQSKPEDQLRASVRIVYWSIPLIFVLLAALLGAFSIPTDVKNNSIHTIVTKPVERFEIVLGRFLGYATILSLGLFVISCLSLVFVIRGVNEEARKESYKARVAEYGYLHFAGTKSAMRADSVGREWGYRSYITGPTLRQPNAVRQYAIWDFPDIPANLAKRTQPIHFEFAFDIFRLSKGEEGKGMFVTFSFVEGARQANDLESLNDEMKRERTEKATAARKQLEKALQSGQPSEEAEKTYSEALASIDKELLAKHRVYQVKGIEVTDFHTQDVEVPPYVFEKLLDNYTATKAPSGEVTPKLRVILSVDIAKEQQMLGVARQDFYLLAAERPFWLNYLKGIVGMWCTHMLVLGVAIACSTYLSSVISLLCTLFLYGAGQFNTYLKEIAERQLDGGGPTESFIRLTKQMPLAARLESSPTTSLIQLVDQFFSWWIGRLMNLIPDLTRYDLHEYVANGFDIGWGNILFLDNFLPLLAFLVPCAIFAYYLMKYREIANPS